MKPTATAWVSKDKDGQMVLIDVVNMENAHLWRWIRYFRRKWRDSGFKGNDAQLDAAIKAHIVTAPMIYAEAAKRGVIDLPSPPAPGAAEQRNRFLLEVAKANPGVIGALKHLVFLPAPINQLVITARTVDQLTLAMTNQQWLAEAARHEWRHGNCDRKMAYPRAR